MILVSGCLLGLNCKYNGGNNYNEKVFNLVKEGKAIPVCPEQLGGLPTPRIPAEIRVVDGQRRVFNAEGVDVTEQFYKGSTNVLELAKKLNIKTCVLKSKSPTCGYGKIYNGNFEGQLIDGNGILTQMLLDNGIEVINSDDIEKIEKL